MLQIICLVFVVGASSAESLKIYLLAYVNLRAGDSPGSQLFAPMVACSQSPFLLSLRRNWDVLAPQAGIGAPEPGSIGSLDALECISHPVPSFDDVSLGGNGSCKPQHPPLPLPAVEY